MATKEQPWPKNARAYRDNAAECNQETIKQLTELLKHKDAVVAARAGVALHWAHQSARWLEIAGAPTQPAQM